MTAEERHEELKRKRHERIRRVKRLLRPLPRRATVHRYPFLKWFAQTARKRSYLWSFKRQYVLPAIYIGSMLSLMPIYGIQIPFAFLLAIVFRYNLMVMVATQVITNPITFVPLYTTACFIGLQVLYVFGVDIPGGSVWDFAATVAAHLKTVVASIFGQGTPSETVASLVEATGMSVHRLVGLAMMSTVIGGAVLGFLIGFVISLVYQLMARYYERSHHAFQMQFEELTRNSRRQKNPDATQDNPNESKAADKAS